MEIQILAGMILLFAGIIILGIAILGFHLCRIEKKIDKITEVLKNGIKNI